MPELPEVETVVRGLKTALPGRTIAGIRLGKTDFIDDPGSLGERLPGSRIVQVERIGKFIRIELAPNPSGEAALNLIVHLGMSGNLVVRRANEIILPHTHAFFELDDGRELRYTDPRRFGQILLIAHSRIDEFRGKLGQEPLEISTADFQRKFAGRKARIKALLLDQRVLRGIGNIYADESLWQARIHPARLASRLNPAELTSLRTAIRNVLKSAIRLRGSSISDFVDSDGVPGSYQQRHRAYGREGKPCFHCGTPIQREIVAGRSSYFCPKCQPASRAKRHRKSASPARAKSAKKRRR